MQLDTSWGDAGVVRTRFGPDYEEGIACGWQSDGKVVMAFRMASTMYGSIGVLRYHNESMTNATFEPHQLFLPLEVWPNSIFDQLEVLLPEENSVSYQIIDNMGRSIQSGKIRAGLAATAYFIPVEQLPSGWYLLQVNNAGNLYLTSFVKF